MRKIFEFVKIGGVWFYWNPSHVEYPTELIMTDNLFFDSLDEKFVRLQMVDPAVAKVTLSKIEGTTYLCKSKNYNERVDLAPLKFDEYPQNLYLTVL